ncbi:MULTISPECIES: beta-N-acetylglucosaminidase domain-containing protein [unclassified Streptomyces]|uniref:beta-N-acetylglucosaminidase domain-containing protein n=1 Tax=unclassified Streptomyces TaxID=2593676 RepID=UPI002E0E8D34|nr:beta-N-acetylglucosaminidase domain-containing protein [Streptomyces sp. NBC_01197]WSS52692.1 beta-N-acetylglucosaminidase domain-containing protein [Streptomyces sp. NBC_01180]
MFRRKPAGPHHSPLSGPLLSPLVAGLALALSAAPLSAVTAGTASAAPKPAAPLITPAPQSESARSDSVRITPSVDIVTGGTTDAAALSLVEKSLKSAGAAHLSVGPKSTRPDRLAVYVGGPGENPSSATALTALGVQGPQGLAAEGYVLAAGRAHGDGAGRIVLSGTDTTGTYYAAQSLRQVLPHRSGPGASVRGLQVRDWPATPVRGTIEGFYGTPWSQAARLDQLDFYGAHKMNIYVYSPKNDAYLRDKWRDAYPADQLARIKELVDRARANHVQFTYALSPGLSACYSSDDDLKALVDKLQTIWDIGVRQFAIPLDDISYTHWNCDADQAKFGTGGGAAGTAQAYLLNRVNQQFIKTHQGAQPLEMVPTEYYNVTPSPYKTAIAGQLDKDVLVEWTGVGVIAPTMTVSQAKSARTVFGHQILTWDNYPVNDYVTDRLLLGPFNGRETGLAEQLAGITANPMIQPYASKLALYTVADYTWNDAAYDAGRSYGQAVHELSGGSPGVERALRAFTDVNYSSSLNKQEAPELSAVISRYWGGKASSRTLAASLRELHDAPAVLRAQLPDKGFVNDAGPWLDSAQAWGTATLAALRMLDDAKAGHGAAAWQERQQLAGLVAKAKAPVYTDMNGGKIPVVVGDGVLDAFVTRALTEEGRLIGLAPQPAGQTDLGVYSGNTAARMTDGDDSTYFWSSAAAAKDDWVGVDLGAQRPISDVTVTMGKPGSESDYLHQGVLEYSSDSSTWHELGSFKDQTTVKATAPAGTTARYVRARATADQTTWVAVREFHVGGADEPAVSGNPPAADGSSQAAAADGNAESVYRASRAPAAGESLDVSLPQARTVRTVTVLAPGGVDGVKAAVQIRTGGQWRTLGATTGPYTRVTTGAVTADAVRLLWAKGSAAPQINEVAVQ